MKGPLICLGEITQENWLEAARLELGEGQSAFVAGPVGILARGYVYRDCRARVYEVAEQVGYRDIAYFSSTFKKLTGMSPSEYQDTSR